MLREQYSFSLSKNCSIIEPTGCPKNQRFYNRVKQLVDNIDRDVIGLSAYQRASLEFVLQGYERPGVEQLLTRVATRR